MKILVFTFVSLVAGLSRGNAFSPIPQQIAKVEICNPLLASLDENNGVAEDTNLHRSIYKRTKGFTAAVVLGWSFATSASFAATIPLNTPTQFFDTSVLVAAKGQATSSDYADFSLPSYEEARASAVNTNLKGSTFLLGEQSRPSSSSDSDSTTTEATPSAPIISKEDAKAQKDAKKAEMKAARDAQKAAADALTGSS